MEKNFEKYWDDRYKNHNLGWDVGFSTPALIKYCLHSVKFSDKILIPGCGTSYEGNELYQHGFENLYLLDIAQEAIKRAKDHHPDVPMKHFIHEDFFEHEGQYDYVLEHIFFCALNPEQREAYVDKVVELLKPHGKLAGVLFDRTFDTHPPYGGSKKEYLQFFEKKMNVIKMEQCTDSIPQRQGTELFFIAEKID